MGACYSTRLEYKLNDKQGAYDALRVYCEKEIPHVLEREKNENGNDGSTFEKLLQILMPNAEFGDLPRSGWRYASAGFDASYSWEVVLMEVMDILAPFMVNTSVLYLSPDNSSYGLRVRNGKVTQKVYK